MDKFESLLKYSKQLSILYVEDHEELRNSTVEILNSLFAKVSFGIDGAEALRTYEEFHREENQYYDIVLTDIKMPNMNGVTLIEEIYKINPQQKIVVLSAHDESEYLVPLINLGINHFIQKPIEFDKLLDVLKDISKSIVEETSIKLDDLSQYDRKSKLLTVNNENVYLTKYEIIFMDILSEEKGKIYKNEEIVSYYNSLGESIDMSNIRKLVSKLRKKIPSQLIESIYSIGYRIQMS